MDSKRREAFPYRYELHCHTNWCIHFLITYLV